MRKTICLFSLVSAFLIVGVFSVQRVFASEVFNTWASISNILTQPIANSSSLIIGDNLYVFGGSNSVGVYDTYFFPIQSNGSLGPQDNTSISLPDGPYWSSFVNVGNNKVLKSGGTNFSGSASSSNQTYYGILNSSGSVTSWSPGPSLPESLSLGATAVVGNWVYYFGGVTWPGITMSNDIYVSPLAGDGSIGNWQSANISLPTPLAAMGIIVQGNKIFLLGGTTNSSFSPTNKVYVFESNPINGNLTRLADEDNLPLNSRSAMVIKVNGYVIHAGGVIAPGPATNIVYFAPIDADGNIGTWELSTFTLPQINCCTAITSWNNYVYIIGGHTNTGGSGNYYNSVIYSQVGNSLPSLTVPDIKQYTSPWKDQEYDGAHLWSNTPTIERWGCALTSTAMVLQFHGHNINPDALNSWLKSQSDGYIRNGLLNWLAISRYTKLHDSPASPTLEYRRLNNDFSQLTAELTAGRPAILEEPGHFVVAKSQLTDTFGINDPAYANRPTLSSYSNTFQSLGSYRPSHTDLSYIMLVTDPQINVGIIGPDGQPAPALTYDNQPLHDDINPANISGQTLKTVLIPTPANGNYAVNLTGSAGQYTLDSYLYNIAGEVSPASYQGIISDTKTDSIKLTIGTVPQIIPQVSITSLLADVEAAYNQGLIKKPVIYKHLKKELGKTKNVVRHLNSLIKYLDHQPVKSIDPATAKILQTNILWALKDLNL